MIRGNLLILCLSALIQAIFVFSQVSAKNVDEPVHLIVLLSSSPHESSYNKGNELKIGLVLGDAVKDELSSRCGKMAIRKEHCFVSFIHPMRGAKNTSMPKYYPHLVDGLEFLNWTELSARDKQSVWSKYRKISVPLSKTGNALEWRDLNAITVSLFSRQLKDAIQQSGVNISKAKLLLFTRTAVDAHFIDDWEPWIKAGLPIYPSTGRDTFSLSNRDYFIAENMPLNLKFEDKRKFNKYVEKDRKAKSNNKYGTYLSDLKIIAFDIDLKSEIKQDDLKIELDYFIKNGSIFGALKVEFSDKFKDAFHSHVVLPEKYSVKVKNNSKPFPSQIFNVQGNLFSIEFEVNKNDLNLLDELVLNIELEEKLPFSYKKKHKYEYMIAPPAIFYKNIDEIGSWEAFVSTKFLGVDPIFFQKFQLTVEESIKLIKLNDGQAGTLKELVEWYLKERGNALAKVDVLQKLLIVCSFFIFLLIGLYFYLNHPSQTIKRTNLVASFKGANSGFQLKIRDENVEQEIDINISIQRNKCWFLKSVNFTEVNDFNVNLKEEFSNKIYANDDEEVFDIQILPIDNESYFSARIIFKPHLVKDYRDENSLPQDFAEVTNEFIEKIVSMLIVSGKFKDRGFTKECQVPETSLTVVPAVAEFYLPISFAGHVDQRESIENDEYRISLPCVLTEFSLLQYGSYERTGFFCALPPKAPSEIEWELDGCNDKFNKYFEIIGDKVNMKSHRKIFCNFSTVDYVLSAKGQIKFRIEDENSYPKIIIKAKQKEMAKTLTFKCVRSDVTYMYYVNRSGELSECQHCRDVGKNENGLEDEKVAGE